MKKKFAKKSFGQNFLQSPIIREKILEYAGDLKNQNILEIGPGLGFLTTKLLQAKANLAAIELDVRSVKILNRDFAHKKNFRLIQGDILKQDLDTIFKDMTYSIIANIPYNITAPILRKIFSQTQNKPVFCILMMQKEVAQKICNPQKRSLLSISVEIFAVPEFLYIVEKEHFSPIPKVDSALVKFTTRPESLISPKDESDFFTVVQAGFSQKRKKLGNFFGGFFGLSSKALLQGIDPNRRAETLSVNEWLSITRNFQSLKTQK